MEIPQAMPVSKARLQNRMVVYLLGLLMLGIMALLPLTASLARDSIPLEANNGSFNERSDFQIGYTNQLTDTLTATATSTVTETPTPTETSTGLPATDTSTPTGTATATATSTSTSTPTPTITGTPPTPTVTGTLTNVPTLKVVVTPAQARVNENFTFTIEAGNNGTEIAENNVVLDSFPTYIDVLTVTANRGTVTKLTHSFVVTIGDIAPGEKVTIIAVVKVNSTLTRTENLTNVVTLTYGVSKSMTASVGYRVVFQTLPPTGDLPLNWREQEIKLVNLIPGMLVMGLGMVLILLGVLSKTHARNNTLWMLSVGSVMVLIGFIAGSAALGAFRPDGDSLALDSVPTSDELIAQAQPLDPSNGNQPHLPAFAFSTPEAVIPIVTLPNYPIPTPDVSVTPKPGDTGPDISPIVRIAIPSLFLDTEVKYVPYDGFTWMITGLRQEVAWMGNTSWPGLGSNTALAGHVTVAGMGDGPFRHLDELQAGEVVILYTEKNMYTYTVRESHVTDEDDLSVTLASDEAQITLITCVDWDDELRSYLNRLVVVAELSQTVPITMGANP